MTLVWGNHGPTTNVYIAKMTDCPCLSIHAVVPIRCHGPLLQPFPHRYTQGAHFSPHAVVFAWVSQTCRKKRFAVITKYKRVGPVKRTNQNSQNFLSFLFYPLYLKSKRLCSAGVCILHIPAFSVLWTLMFFTLDLFYYMWEGRERVQSSSLGDQFTQFLALFKVPNMQLHSLEGEAVCDVVSSVFIQYVCSIFAKTKHIKQFIKG